MCIIILILISSFHMTISEVQILDYSNSQLIAVDIGKAKIHDGNFKLIHVIELDKYQEFTENFKNILIKDITESHPLFPYLEHENEQIQNLLKNLKIHNHRSKRYFNLIGTAWKWIAGNPDHEDFTIIQDKINNVLRNNNKQFIINQLYNDRINNLINITNEINNAILKESSFNDRLAFNFQYKLKLIKEELTNIAYAIHWAKSGIVNSLILSSSEMNSIIDLADKESLPYATPEEALDFATVKIITNNTCLFYIVNIPLTTNETFNKLLIKPVKKNNSVNEINYKFILSNKRNTFGITKDCKTINILSICNKNNIVNISNSTCIPKLLKSLSSSCNKINSHHIPSIDEISDGILLLNQFMGTLKFQDTSHNLSGTYIVKYHNMSMTIEVNGTKFISRETSSMKALPPIMQPTLLEKKYHELLSLEIIKEIQINNTEQIDLFNTEKIIYQSISYSSIAVIILIIIIIAICKIKQNKTIIFKTKEKFSKNENPSLANDKDESKVPNSTNKSVDSSAIIFELTQSNKCGHLDLKGEELI